MTDSHTKGPTKGTPQGGDVQGRSNSMPAGAGGSGSEPCCAGESVARVTLSGLRVGQTGVVCETCMDKRDASMLRAMGLRPRARIRVCRVGEPLIVEVLGACEPDACAKPTACTCRIGLARALAERVLLEPGSIQ